MSASFGRPFDELGFEKMGPGSRFMKDFESHKRDFGYSPNRDQDYNIDLDHIYEINLVIPGAATSTCYDSDESVVRLSGQVQSQRRRNLANYLSATRCWNSLSQLYQRYSPC
jgi:hypothetical protein